MTSSERQPQPDDMAGGPEPLSFEFTCYVRDACLCLHTQRAARMLARRFDEALQPVALTSGQFSLLMSLNRAQAPTISSVATLLAMDRTTLTANLKPLVRQGLATVAVDPDDRRSRRLALTPAGRARLAEAAPLWRAAHAAVEDLVGEADRLRAALQKLR